ncbi:Fic family protein [Pedobacter sp.]|uniref:Fic family protein n=1 Tax=Pedobacter sp. TaxID=1411316 RepID=UPI00356B487D
MSLLICFGQEAESSKELMIKLGIKHRQTFLYTYLQVALTLGLIEMTLPDKPNSRFQKYKLTPLGARYRKDN